MRTTLYAILFSLIGLISCQKEEEETTNAGSGSGTNDPCLNVTCLNGGWCLDGSCQCPPGFTGSQCENQIEPVGMVITQIQVLSFPQYDGGVSWDFSSGPDVIVYGGAGSDCSGSWSVPTYFQNATSGNFYSWNVNWSVSNLNQVYSICLYDWDDITDDFMGGVSFYPSNYTSGLPDLFQVNYNGVSFRLYVNWVF